MSSYVTYLHSGLTLACRYVNSVYSLKGSNVVRIYNKLKVERKNKLELYCPLQDVLFPGNAIVLTPYGKDQLRELVGNHKATSKKDNFQRPELKKLSSRLRSVSGGRTTNTDRLSQSRPKQDHSTDTEKIKQSRILFTEDKEIASLYQIPRLDEVLKESNSILNNNTRKMNCFLFRKHTKLTEIRLQAEAASELDNSNFYPTRFKHRLRDADTVYSTVQIRRIGNSRQLRAERAQLTPGQLNKTLPSIKPGKGVQPIQT